MSGRPDLDRVYEGDALAVLKSWPDGFVDLLVTDPPYGNATTYGRAKRRIEGDEHPLIGLAVLAQSYRLLRRNASAYMFADIKHLSFIEAFVERYTRFRVRDVLVWDKVRIGLGYAFRKRYELIVALEKGRPKYRDRSLANIIAVPRVRTDAHPHTKPVDLITRLIETSSDPGDIVLDPFAGSGAICRAAAIMDRRYLGIELDPHYAALAAGSASEDLGKHSSSRSSPSGSRRDTRRPPSTSRNASRRGPTSPSPREGTE